MICFNRIQVSDARVCAVAALVVGLVIAKPIVAQEAESKSGRALIVEQAEILKPFVKSELGQSFLDGAKKLPKVNDRLVYLNRNVASDVISAEQASVIGAKALAKYSPRTLGEEFFYTTRYGTPLAFVRPLEVVSRVSSTKLKGSRVIDFGCGTIGHLRMMAAQGANVTGIDVDRLLKALYSNPSDTGQIENEEQDGQLEMLFGQYPSELGADIKGDADFFISKNTLKRGFIHPEKPAPARLLIDLGCTDEEFVQDVRSKLKLNGLFLIYNLHPAPAADGQPYKPWADGRSPFDRGVFEANGFEVIGFDVDDTPAVHEMAKLLGWDKQMDLGKNLFATYTLVKRIK